MSESKLYHLIYAFITVIITVPCFVFYCSSVEAGGFTIDVIKNSLVFIPIEFILAYVCAIFIGNPLAMKIANKIINPKETTQIVFENVIVCSTVLVMCPLMSLLATFLYDGIIAVGFGGGDLGIFLMNIIPYWLQKVVINFPFALLSQVFFIQPLVRNIMPYIMNFTNEKA